MMSNKAAKPSAPPVAQCRQRALPERYTSVRVWEPDATAMSAYVDAVTMDCRVGSGELLKVCRRLNLRAHR